MTERPVIYQVMTRLFGADGKHLTQGGTRKDNGCGKMRDFTGEALSQIKQMGCNCIWYTGILQHATKSDYTEFGIDNDNPDLVKGNAGSPYAVKDYYDVCPDLAVKVEDRMKELENLVKRTHKAGLKMIIDFIPNHVAAEYKGKTNPFTDENYYPGRIHDGDWTDTAKLNYGSKDTWHKMLDIMLFWAGKGIDGMRCDMAELVPCDFWNWAIPQVKAVNSDFIFIAEVYNPGQYRDYIYHGHFDYLYDKVGLYDSLKNVVQGRSASNLTSCWQEVDDIKDHMVNFLENHDEQRIASRFFAGNEERGKAMLLVSALMRTNPFMLYFGQDLGEAALDKEGFSGDDGRTSIFDYWTVDKIRRWRNGGKFDGKLLTAEEIKLHEFYSSVLRLCNEEEAIREGSFFDLMYANYDNPLMNTNRQYAFLRKSAQSLVLVVANFEESDTDTDIIIPRHAFECMGLKHGQRKAIELLSGEKLTLTLEPDSRIHLTLPANCGTVIKIKQ